MALHQQDPQAEFFAYAESRPKISTHCHQLPGQELRAFDLDALLRNSYVAWCGISWGNSPQSYQVFFEKISFNSFFVWLQKSLTLLYGDNTTLTVSSWHAWTWSLQACNGNIDRCKRAFRLE